MCKDVGGQDTACALSISNANIIRMYLRKNHEDVYFFGTVHSISGQFITTSAEVTPNGGLVRESPPKWP